MKTCLILLLCSIGASAFPTPDEPIANREYVRYEGDIIPNEDTMIRGKRGAGDINAAKWPTNKVISYKIESSYNSDFARSIRNAFQFYSDNTCLTYEENGSTTPYLRVLRGNDCASQIGMTGGQSQPLYLDNGCESVGTIAHEIAHSIGLGHTQMRSDRDSYVTINLKNIGAGMSGNFDKWSTQRNNNFGVEYDYSSVMHYDSFGFAVKTNIPVITARDPNSQSSLGQRERVAFSDIKMINSMYNCAQKCPSASIRCQNGGIINSKKCNTCICPYMFTGADCSQRHPGRGLGQGCGQDLTATSTWQNFKGSYGEFSKQYDNSECFWNIKAPAGRKIEVRLNASDFLCHATCKWNGMEVFTKGFVIGGYKFCCPDQFKGEVFQSLDNALAIRLFSIYHIAGINVDYRTI